MTPRLLPPRLGDRPLARWIEGALLVGVWLLHFWPW